MHNLLIGGLITLIVTCLTQIFIIPFVQRNIRRQERWEKDLIELTSLLSIDLQNAIEKYMMISIDYTSAIEVAKNETRPLSEGGQKYLMEALGDAIDKAQGQYDIIESILDKIEHYHSRIWLPKMDLSWRKLGDSLDVIRAEFSAISPYAWRADLTLDLEGYDNRLSRLARRALDADFMFETFTRSVRTRLFGSLNARITDSKIDWSGEERNDVPNGAAVREERP